MLPLARQYGLTYEEFWYGDPALLTVAQIAYMRDKSYTAWLQGAKNFEAYSKALSNSNRAKKTDKVLQYDDWVDPIVKYTKTKLTKEELEAEFRKQQIEQNEWLFGKK